MLAVATRRVRAGQPIDDGAHAVAETVNALADEAYRSGLQLGDQQGFMRGVRWCRLAWFGIGFMAGAGAVAIAITLGLQAGARLW